ncbi:hypothetical protein [Campylobacter sp.]|uniref:hypothetical protein n=1 Tax=Campylobacter sp. TaxID=205 RepID=UPI002AA64E13|nr:hypothetical protein [Campylobacter sp.]MCI7237204.1 hypothetical protein [Campylobacter sp.]
MSFCFPCYPFIYCVCSGSAFYRLTALRGCRLAFYLFLSAGSAFKRFLALKPCAALRLTQKLLLAFLCYA